MAQGSGRDSVYSSIKKALCGLILVEVIGGYWHNRCEYKGFKVRQCRDSLCDFVNMKDESHFG